MTELKEISFEKSLKYFIKDKNYYEVSDCHTNTYSKFYDKNCEEVDSRSKDFSFITGLLTYSDNKK